MFFDSSVFSQNTDSTFIPEPKDAPPIKITGFIDAYYAYDLNQPLKHEVSAPFLYNYKRHDEFNVNLGLLSGA